MIEFIVAVDPRPNTKARHFVSVAQALGRGLIRPCCHARKRDRFSAHRKYQKILDRLDLLRHVAPPFTHFLPRRALIFIEAVATDGPMNERRKRAFEELATEAGYPLDHVAFVTAYLDRSGTA